MYHLKINPEDPDPDMIRQAAEVIRSGGVIVYPTDTLYGFGVDMNNPTALEKLIRLKGSQAGKPLSVLINNKLQAEQLTGSISGEVAGQFDKLLPGKITLLISRRIPAPIPFLDGFTKIGLRYPAHKISNALVTELGFPISSTSVNLSGQANLKHPHDIIKAFGKQIDLILDAGPVSSLLGSTILDCSVHPPRLLREGEVSQGQIESLLGFKITAVKKKFLILFICSGNICRSPMAEGILNRILSKTRYKEMVSVKSAGTYMITNVPAAPEAIDIAMQYDIPLARHRSQALTGELLAAANLVLCMALNHYNFINANYPEHREKVFLLRQWQEKIPLSNPSIGDPIGQNFEFFKNIFNQIYIEIMRVLPEIFKLLKAFDTTMDNKKAI
jgi:L-threonylcarbamoyladenylate synthase